jgi:nucleotide-binding universal stress UspA family protein
MYEKILVAVDHSAASDHAVAAAKDLATLSKGEVWVLHLAEREVIGRMGGEAPIETDAEAETPVDTAVKTLTDAGITAHGELRETTFGHAAKEIMADAKLHDVGIIVMGSRGRGDMAGLVLGSTAHKVIHLADRPVLVVH